MDGRDRWCTSRQLLLPPLLLLLVPALVPALVSAEKCEPLLRDEESPPAANTSFISNNNTLLEVEAGENAVLPCRVHQPHTKRVAWVYQPSRRLLTVQDRAFTQDKRVSAQFFRHTEMWTLYIRNVNTNDTGIYECQLSSHPWERLHVRLRVTDPAGSNSTGNGPLMTRDYYEPGFRIASDTLCPHHGAGVKVMMMVQSAPGNAEIRQVLRKTWAKPAIEREDVVLGFLLARTNDSAVQAAIQRESDTFGDIIQASFVDHYNNLTLKSLATLEWFDTYCRRAQFVLKVDDDLFVSVDNLVTFIEHHQNERRVVYGNVVYDPKPDRNLESRYYTSPEVWDKPKYPKYTGGPIYLISSDATRGIYKRVMERPYLFIEDVTITGIGAQLAGVRRKRAPEMFTYHVPSSKTCLFRLLIGAHQIPTEDLEDIWRRVQDPHIECPQQYSPTLWDQCVGLKLQESLRHCVMMMFSKTNKTAKHD
ncbi:beta-1,3-galactosyltransferase 5-like [Pollicipes pollicipes]|uniref:beta-1,3-galactosyltransferase 5-like n=1 Tax=Pollicipes pollicipes TaxID=41117 RepID=UPI00188545DB|nr:beta-1,3-galactosyltransferase 5-like [Pollicipes pollicipes]